MRINIISDRLNVEKLGADNQLIKLAKDFEIRKGGPNPMSASEFNKKVKNIRDEFMQRTKVKIGQPVVKNGKLTLNFKQERLMDLDNPRNTAIKQAMNNLVNQSDIKFQGIDQKLMFANNTKERFNILKNASLEALQNSKYLQAFAKMSGKVGKAANTILKTKTGKVGAVGGAYGLLSTIASADEPHETDLIDEVALTGKTVFCR